MGEFWTVISYLGGGILGYQNQLYNVNKISSRVTLWFDVVNSPSLSEEQKELIQNRLATRIGKNGTLRVISQQTRSQVENKILAMERFAELLRDAVKQVPVRKKTRMSKGLSSAGWRRKSSTVC